MSFQDLSLLSSQKIRGKVWGLLFLLAGTIPLAAQTPPDCSLSISGIVNDTQSREHLIGGSVFALEAQKAVAANAEGEYQITGLCPGRYTIVCSYVGHVADTAVVMLEGASIILHFHLQEDETQLSTVTIQAKMTLSTSTQAVGMLEGSTLERTRGRSLGESLKEITGVSTLQTGPSIFKPVIQGLHSNRILILNNGIRQEGQQWGSEHAPEIDPFVATKLSVIKGAAAVRYGPDAIGGVVLVEPPALKKEAGIQGELNLVGISNGIGGVASAVVEGGSGKWKGLGWRLQGTYKRLGDSHAARYNLTNTGLRELNFSGALGYHREHFGLEAFYSRFNTDLAILQSAHTGSLDDLEKAINSPVPLVIGDFTYAIDYPRQQVSHDLIKLNTYYRFPNAGKISLQYGGQFNSRQEYDRRRGGRSDTPEQYMQLTTHTLDAVFEDRERKSWDGSAGMTASLQDNFNNPITGINPLIPQYTNTGLGIFLIERWIKERIELELGARYDYRFLDVKIRDRSQNLLNPQYTFHNTSGTLGLLYRLNGNSTFRSNLATAWRPPNAAELFSNGLHHGTGTIERGNEGLQTEKAYKWINTYNYSNRNVKDGKGLELELSAYHNYIQNYIYLEPRDVELTIRGAFPVFNYNQTNATFTGLDASLHWFFAKNLSWRSKASLVRARDASQDGYLIFIPADRYENAITYQAARATIFKDLFFSFSVLNVAAQSRAPQVFTVGQLREATASPDDALAIPQQTFDFAIAPKGYTLLNLEMGFSLPRHLNVNVGVNNLLNTSYRDYMNRFRYYADDIGRNVTVKIKYTFPGCRGKNAG
jgi:iron complex outermembrane receptor protein